MENTIETIKNSIEAIKDCCDLTETIKAELNLEANVGIMLDILEYIINKLEPED